MAPDPQLPQAPQQLVALAFERHGQAIQSFLFRLLGRRDDAETLGQEVWVRMLRTRPVFVDDLALRSWLYRVAKNLVVDHGRRSRLRVVADAEANELAGPQPEPLAQAVQQESVDNLLGALDRLREPYRTTLILRFLQQLDYTEIAAIEEVSESALRTRVQKGLELLRDALHLSVEPMPRGRHRRARV